MPRYTVEEAYSEDEEPSAEEVEPSAIEEPSTGDKEQPEELEQPQDSVSVSAGQGLTGVEGTMTAAEGQVQQPIGNPNNEEQDPERQFLKLPEKRAMPDIAEGRSGSVVITGNQNTTEQQDPKKRPPPALSGAAAQKIAEQGSSDSDGKPSTVHEETSTADEDPTDELEKPATGDEESSAGDDEPSSEYKEPSGKDEEPPSEGGEEPIIRVSWYKEPPLEGKSENRETEEKEEPVIELDYLVFKSWEDPMGEAKQLQISNPLPTPALICLDESITTADLSTQPTGNQGNLPLNLNLSENGMQDISEQWSGRALHPLAVPEFTATGNPSYPPLNLKLPESAMQDIAERWSGRAVVPDFGFPAAALAVPLPQLPAHFGHAATNVPGLIPPPPVNVGVHIPAPVIDGGNLQDVEMIPVSDSPPPSTDLRLRPPSPRRRLPSTDLRLGPPSPPSDFAGGENASGAEMSE
ncbi:unnamed protein product [Linum trigynum]|uniref:Uncharacterized protein n=1 Tax=Linum trigynum TaxID=586398 RepID=A0AAV2GE74_9ROSI